MYTEQTSTWPLLIQKTWQKKFSLKIGPEGITENLLVEITKKQYHYLSTTQPYQTFESYLYDKASLQHLVMISLFSMNCIEVQPFLSPANPLSLKGNEIKSWLATDFPIDFIYNSNTIEGSKIPKSEIEKILQQKKYSYKVKNEIQEVKNSIKAWKFLQQDFLWNIANIKKLYHILTKELLQETSLSYPRGFKKVANVVWNSDTTSPEQVEPAISRLLSQLKEQKKSVFPLQSAFDFHLKYEQIHPFENGNGRTGRLLMNKILIQNWMLPMIVFKDNKEAYFNAIKGAVERGTVGIKGYYNFMIEQYQKTIIKFVPYL